ncbi:MAG: glycoside hydrolase family 3 protein [Anaerolineae bacterium]|nr:glycoside hydrolase family 3 protein [Anaerolineae bacterium]
MKVIKRAALIFVVFWLFFFLPTTTPVTLAQDPDPVAEMMASMSVEDKVGQLFIVPFVGSTANPDSDIWQLVTEYRVGGVVLLAANSNFENNPSAPRQITELNNALQTIGFQNNNLPLFVAIDQEGDAFPYSRITGGVTPIPSQMAIGATWDVGNAEAIGQIVGEEMSAMGINMVLGPGLDVLNDPRPTGRGDIGTRVYGGDPYWVSQIGRAYIRGVHEGSGGRIATVAKHFPGHGGSDRLPDNEVATVDKSLQELRRIELPPFFHVTAELKDDPLGVTDALMSSHIRYRGFQGDIRQFTAPISFDAEGMRTLLTLPEIVPWRDSGGLVVSDALGVPAVRKHFDPSLQNFPHRRIAKEAFLAGNDVLLLVQFDLRSIWSDQFANIKDTIFFFRVEYINNPTFAAQVDRAVERILRLKLKLYPELTLEALNQDPTNAVEVTAKPQPLVNSIAQESLTLLYPSPEELRLRIPQPPRPDENILIVNDTRFTRECYLESCEPVELYIPRTAIEETILRLYGPQATGQIQQENISTITFAELKQALGGALITPLDPTDETQQPVENKAIQLTPEEVRERIQAADWLIFSTLDLNTSRFNNSDALKLFLSQENGTLRDKTSIVLAFNAPYYLDTTEVTKLTAYYGVYSKTQPHIETVVRALFGEVEPQGASPVSVEGIGYELADVLAPDPDQELPITLLEDIPDNSVAPVTIKIQTGAIIDHNGHVVPDDTPVEIKALRNGRETNSQMVSSINGVVEAQINLLEPGDYEIMAIAGQAESSEPIHISVLAPPTPTPEPVTPTSTRTLTATPTDSPTATMTATPVEATDTPVPLASNANVPPGQPQASPSSTIDNRPLDGIDLLSALAATLLAGIVGFRLGQQSRRPLSQRVRLGLWVLIGGLLAYLCYGAGWLRPEQWAFESPDLFMGRLAVAALAFVFGLVAILLSGQMLKAHK